MALRSHQINVRYVVDVADRGTKALLAEDRRLRASVNKTGAQMAASSRRASAASTSASRSASRQASAYGKTSSSARRAEGAIRGEARAAQMSKAAHTGASVSVQRTARSYDQVARSASRAEKARRKETARARESARGAAGGARSALGFAGFFGVAGAIKQTVDFDKAMRNVNSIAQLSEGSLKGLSKQVRELGGRTAQSPITLAKGLYDLVSSGFNAKESMQILGKSAKAATAGLTTTEVSTKAVAAVLNAYHLPASKAGVVSDQLFQTVNKGVISFEQLSQSIGDVLPFSSQLGVGLDQVGASVATMTKAGIGPEETMTRIKNVMVSMLKPSESLQSTIKGLGYTSGEQIVHAKGFQGALDAIAKTTHGSKTELAKLFPNIRSLGGALALTGKNSRGANKDLAAMKDTAGATDKALQQQAKSTSYQWNQLKANASSIGIAVGSVMLPVLNTAITGLLHFGQQHPNIMKVAGALLAVGAAIKAIKFVSALAGIDDMIAGLRRLSRTRPAMAIADQVGGFAGGRGRGGRGAPAGGFVDPARGPQSPIVAGGPAAGERAGARGRFGRFGRGAAGGAGAAVAIGGGIAASQMAPGAARNVTTGASTGAGIGMMFGPEGAAVGAAAGAAIGAAFTKSIRTKVVNFFKTFWKPILGFIAGGPLLGGISALVGAGLTSKLRTAISKAFNSALSKLGLSGIARGVAKIVTVIARGFVRLPGQIGRFLSGVPRTIGKVFTGIPRTVGKAITSTGRAILKLPSLASRAIPLMARWAGRMVGFVATLPIRIPIYLIKVGVVVARLALRAGKWLVSKFADGASGLWGWLKKLPGRVGTYASSMAKTVARWASRAGSWLGSKIAAGASNFWGWLKKLPGRAASFISSLPGRVGHIASSGGSHLFSGIKSGASGLWGWLKSLPGKIGHAIGDLATKLYNKAKEAGKQFAKGLIAGIGDLPGKVAHDVGSLPGSIKKKLGFRRGGVIGFQEGGMVPVAVSSGEMAVLPGGRAMMIPGASVAADNVPAAFPAGTAIITGDGQQRMAAGASMAETLATQRPHFQKGGRVRAGNFVSTSYGPPWGGIQGTGTTRTNVNLHGSPHIYGVAVDPARVPLGTNLSIHPNPFHTRHAFRAFDTGGAIKGNRIDFYDWRGRKTQLGWGRRGVHVEAASSKNTAGGGGSGSSSRSVRRSATLKLPPKLSFGGGLPSAGGAFASGYQAGTARGALTSADVFGDLAAGATAQFEKRSQKISWSERSRRGDRGSSSRSKNPAYAAMWNAASRISGKHFAYKWGGGHNSGFAGPYDCCLIGDSLVQTVDGPMRIEDMQGGEEIYTWDDGELSINRVLRRSEPRTQQTYALRTTSRRIEASGNHPFLRAISNDDGVAGHTPATWRYEWVELDDLDPGDLIVTVNSLPDDKSEPAGEWERTPEFWWLVGLGLGDGHLPKDPKSATRVNLCVYGDLRERAQGVLSRLVGRPGTPEPSAGLYVYSRPLRDAMERLGVGAYSPERQVPDEVWQLPHDLIRAFLDGYADADGSWSERDQSTAMHSTSYWLLAQVRLLHIRIGDRATPLRKQERRADHEIKGTPIPNAKPLWSFSTQGAGRRNHGQRWRLNRWLDRELPRDGTFYVEPVRSIEPLEVRDTYDITVEGTHNFIAEGIVVHNSGGVSAVLHAGNKLSSPLTSGALAGWGAAGRGHLVTVYANPKHTFMELGRGHMWGTAGDNPGGGAGWMKTRSTAGFAVRHPKGMRAGGLIGPARAQTMLKRLPKRQRTASMLASIERTGMMPGLRAGGKVKASPYGNRKQIVAWMKALYAQAAPYFGRSPRGGLPFSHISLSGDAPFAGYGDDPGQEGKGKGDLYWPSWLFKNSYDKGKRVQGRLGRRALTQLFFHETAHRFQNPKQTASETLAEGGAEAFARMMMRRTGRRVSGSGEYGKFVRQVTKQQGHKWIAHGQFAGGPLHTGAGGKGYRAGGRVAFQTGGRTNKLPKGGTWLKWDRWEKLLDRLTDAALHRLERDTNLTIRNVRRGGVHGKEHRRVAQLRSLDRRIDREQRVRHGDATHPWRAPLRNLEGLSTKAKGSQVSKALRGFAGSIDQVDDVTATILRQRLKDFNRDIKRLRGDRPGGHLGRESTRRLRRDITQIRRGGVTPRERPRYRRLRGEYRRRGEIADTRRDARGVRRQITGRIPSYGGLEGMETRLGRQVKRLQAHGVTQTERVQIRRLRAAQRVVETEMGRRTGLIVSTVEKQADTLERARTKLSVYLRFRGIDEASAQGEIAMAALYKTQVGQQQKMVKSLNKALTRAKRRGDRDAVTDIQDRLKDLRDQVSDTAASYVEQIRAAINQAAQDRVDAAGHVSTMASSALTNLGLMQQLAGIYDTGGQARANYIKSTIVPDLQKEIVALRAQQAAALKTGNATLAREIAEAIAGKGTDILQALVDAKESTDENTDALKDMTGTIGFEYQGQSETDLLGVVAGA